MAPRRRGRWLLVLGGILIAVGLFVLVSAIPPQLTQETAAIAPNDVMNQTEYFAQLEWSVLAGGRVQGTFQSLNGTPVTVFVYNDADYIAYMGGQNLSGLYTVTAVNGSLNLEVPGWNTYHVVFAHGPGYGSLEQDVAVDLTTTGIDPGFFLGGLAVAVLGAVAVAFAIRRMRRPVETGPPGVFDSRATYLPPPTPPSGPDWGSPGGSMYRVPPPLPGTPPSDGIAASPSAAPSSTGAMPTGDVVLTLENRSAGVESVQLLVNGAAVTAVTVPAGTTQTLTVTARLASPFGSMVTVQAVTSSGRRYEQSVFVGARGTAPLSLRIA